MTNIKELFDNVFNKAKNIQERIQLGEQVDGKKAWNDIENKIKNNDSWQLKYNDHLRQIYYQMNKLAEKYNINKSEFDPISNHFFMQLQNLVDKKSGFKVQLNRLLQIAFNAGQLSVFIDKKILPHDMIKFVIDNKLLELDTYIDLDKQKIINSQSGGNNEINLYDLLTKCTHKEIEEKLDDEVWKIGSFCDKYVGSGYFSHVVIPTVGSYMDITIGENIFKISVVNKHLKEDKSGTMTYHNHNDNLIIGSNFSLTCEAIMLYFISKHWYRGLNLHLPFMVGFGCCDPLKKSLVTNIILHKNGLSKEIELHYDKFVQDTLDVFEYRNKYDYLATLEKFSDYLMINEKKLSCVLPNGKEIYIPDIIDQCIIFYLHTSHYVWEYFNLTLIDQHLNNIFIHWLDEFSICGKEKLENKKYIFYKIGTKYIKVPMHGFIFKLGDIGTCVMTPQKNVFIVGYLTAVNDVVFDNIITLNEKHKFYYKFFGRFIGTFPTSIVEKTRSYKLFNKYFNELYHLGFTKDHETQVPNELDLLNDSLFDDLKVDTINENTEDCFIID